MSNTILVRDRDQLIDSSLTVPFDQNTKEEALDAAARRLLMLFEEAKHATSHDNALKVLADIRELIEAVDRLHEREVSYLQLSLRDTFGSYDKLLSINV